MDCKPNPDMQGFTVRLAIFLSHTGMAFLLNINSEDSYNQVRMCFYALFFQLFPIIIGTLVSFIQGNLSPADAWFALLVMLSPTTLELLDLLPYDLRHTSKWSLREIIDGIFIALLLALSIALYIIIVVFLSRDIDSCPLEGFYYSIYDSQTEYYVVFAISLLTVCLTIFHIPGYQTMKYLLSVLLWSPGRGYRASMIITIVFSIIEGMQVLGAAQAICVIERWGSQIALSPLANSSLLPTLRKGLTLARVAITIAIFADPTGKVTLIAIFFCLIGELVVLLPGAFPVISLVQISASWIQLISEAAIRIHPGRGAFLSTLFYAQWGLMLGVITLEPNYKLTYGQIVSSLTFLPIAAECLKLAFHEHYRLTLRSIRLASFPLWPSHYKKLSNDDVFPDYFWTNKTRTAIAASILGLSWAGCVVADRLPPHTTMRTIVYSAYPSIRFPEFLRDYLEDKSDDLNSRSNRPHQPIEMKTMPPSGNAPKTPLSFNSTTSFLSGTIVEEPDRLSDEGNVLLSTGRDDSVFGAAISSRASLPKPVTTPHRRFVKPFLGRR